MEFGYAHEKDGHEKWTFMESDDPEAIREAGLESLGRSYDDPTLAEIRALLHKIRELTDRLDEQRQARLS